MKSAKIADLKNNLSRYLAHVRAGGEVMVLDRALASWEVAEYYEAIRQMRAVGYVGGNAER